MIYVVGETNLPLIDNTNYKGKDYLDLYITIKRHNYYKSYHSLLFTK